MKNLLYIGNKLSGKGVNVTTIETLGTLLSSEGYSVSYASGKKNPVFRLADMVWTTIRLRNQVDFVLIDTYSTSGFWFAFIVSQLCRILKMKYIPILHGGNLPFRLKKNPELCRMIFENAYQNVSPSNYLLGAFQNVGFKNLVFIPNTIEIANYPFINRAEIWPKLLWVRAFSSIYNPKMAVAVFAEIKKSYPHAKLCMVGPERDGSMEMCKRYAEEKGVEVQFTGKLPKQEWISLAKDFDIFINTTHLDNTPVSVMEAMALGLPVVTTNVGGLPYLLNHGADALLVDDDDVQTMVAAIRNLIEQPQLSKMLISNARKKAEDWDWKTIVHQWNRLLN